MSKAGYTLADVEAMLRACAPDARLELKKHKYWAIRGSVIFTDFPKGQGAGGAKKSRIRVEDGRIRKCVTMLGIARECVERRLPDLWR